jgi:hypothetical protein
MTFSTGPLPTLNALFYDLSLGGESKESVAESILPSDITTHSSDLTFS